MFDVRMVVTQALTGQTAAAAVRQLRPGLSWGQARQLIAARRLRVNGTVCVDETRRVAFGEVLELGEQSAPPPPASLTVRFVDEHLAVVEKPAHVLSERRREEAHWKEGKKARLPTLDELLREVLMAPKRRTGYRHLVSTVGVQDVYPVHRLDRETSGLMLYALTPQSRASLVAEFAAHNIQRTYLAIVHGRPAGGTIRSQLVRDRGDGLRGSVGGGRQDPDSQEAITHLALVESIGDYSLVRCRLETGRTHQIRIHLCESGHPLCGERVYTHLCGEAAKRDESGCPRVALHSAELMLKHPITGRTLHFESPLPKDLARWLDRLRRQA